MSTDRDVTKTLAVKEFVAELRRFADTLEAGKSFAIEIEGETVQVPLEAVCSIEHEREDGEEEIEFQVTWSSAASEGDDDAETEDKDEDGSEEKDEEKSEGEPAKAA